MSDPALADLNVRAFVDRLASDDPTPPALGGGSHRRPVPSPVVEVPNYPLTRASPRVHVSNCCACSVSALGLEQTVTLAVTRTSRRPRQPKAATTNRVRDYQALEREYLAGTMSLRELCRTHGVTAHSAVMVQARRGDWAEKRGKYRARASTKYIEQRADRAALREAEVRDHAVEAIDEAITKMRADMKATVIRNGVEEPAMRIYPKDLALLIDRLNVLFGRPGTISEERSLSATITSEPLPVDVLEKIIEATRGLETRAPEASPLPRLQPRLDD